MSNTQDEKSNKTKKKPFDFGETVEKPSTIIKKGENVEKQGKKKK